MAQSLCNRLVRELLTKAGQIRYRQIAVLRHIGMGPIGDTVRVRGHLIRLVDEEVGDRGLQLDRGGLRDGGAGNMALDADIVDVGQIADLLGLCLLYTSDAADE